MNLDIKELVQLVALEDAERAHDSGPDGRLRRRPSGAGRALELAISVIEILRERGTLTGEELCRVAVRLGYDEPAVLRAWNSRCEFDMDATHYPPLAPLARFQNVPEVD